MILRGEHHAKFQDTGKVGFGSGIQQKKVKMSLHAFWFRECGPILLYSICPCPQGLTRNKIPLAVPFGVVGNISAYTLCTAVPRWTIAVYQGGQRVSALVLPAKVYRCLCMLCASHWKVLLWTTDVCMLLSNRSGRQSAPFGDCCIFEHQPEEGIRPTHT